jgi:hypothetical protein
MTITPETLDTVVQTLATAALLAAVKFLADVRKQLASFRQLFLGYEDKGGGLIDQMEQATKVREKFERDLNQAFERIRNVERETHVTPPPPKTPPP